MADRIKRDVYWDDISYAARLEWNKPENDMVCWVDWKLFATCPQPNGERLWMVDGASHREGTIDIADEEGNGFCKWDSCFQGTFDVHFDYRNEMVDLHEALQRLYDVIGEVVGFEYIEKRKGKEESRDGG